MLSDRHGLIHSFILYFISAGLLLVPPSCHRKDNPPLKETVKAEAKQATSDRNDTTFLTPEIRPLDKNKVNKTKALKPQKIPLQYLTDRAGKVLKDKNGKEFPLGMFGGYTPMKKYTSDDGLPLGSVYSFMVDHAGELWLATLGGGLCCFDGKTFYIFRMENGLQSDIIFDIDEDRKGNIWIATDGGGLNCYNGKSFTSYTTKDGLSSNYLRSVLVDDNGIIWVGTKDAGVSRFDGRNFKNYSVNDGLPDNYVSDIVMDKKSNFWFSTRKGISCFNGVQFFNYGLSQGLPSERVNHLAVDQLGHLWIATGSGLSCYDGSTFYNFGEKNGFADTLVNTIIKDKQGNLWIGTAGGVSRISHEEIEKEKIADYTFSLLTENQGLVPGIISSIVQDRDGNIWFASQTGGIACFSGASLITYNSFPHVWGNIIISIAAGKKDNIWLSSFYHGLIYFDGDAFYKYTMKEGLPANIVSCMLEDNKGGVWIGTDGNGLSYFDGKTFSVYTEESGLPNNGVVSILEDEKKNLWIGTRGGLSYFDGNKFINYSVKDGLVNNNVLSIIKDGNGKLWLATNEGVSSFDGKSFTNYTMESGLVNDLVFSVAKDNSENIWAGTAKGLSCLTAASGYKQFVNFTSANGLPDNFVTQVLMTPDHKKMVIGTNYGLAYFDPEATVKDGRILRNSEVFNSSTGYPIKDINVGTHCMYIDNKGILWAGEGETSSLVRFDYNAVNREHAIPAPLIRSVRINGNNIPWYLLSKKGSFDSSVIAQQEVSIYKTPLSVSAGIASGICIPESVSMLLTLFNFCLQN